MNAYQKQLISEQGAEFTNKLMKMARRIVKLSNSQFLTAKEQSELNRNSDMGYARHMMIAVTAVLFNGNMTANEDEILGKAFTRKDWNELVDEGMVQWFRVAPPYQFVFLMN